MIYQKKVECYAGDNILAQALNPTAYHKNPQFLPLAAQYGFEAILHFNKESITSRANIYLQMAIDIWDPEAIKELAGGWTDEEEQEFIKDTRLREFTVEYLGRSWQDALKYGFLSADETNSGRYLRNIHVGDTIYCHIAGYGFLGIGICASKAVYMKDFCVLVDGVSTPIMKAPWINPEKRDQLVAEKEIFIGVDWKKSVSDESQGYWEKGMTSIPLVAYMLNDRTTHRKVSEHCGYQPE